MLLHRVRDATTVAAVRATAWARPIRVDGRPARHVLLALAVLAGLILPVRTGAVTELIPSPTPIVTGTPGNNGWYTSNVTVRWTISESANVKNTSGCDARTLTTDTGGRDLTCAVESLDGVVSGTVRIKIDKTPPDVGAPHADRSPEASGWYTHPVTFLFTGNDATSGIESCTSLQYSGPDSEAAAVAGTCRDRAGNLGRQRTFTFKYDATAPALAGVTVTPGDRSAVLRWEPASDSAFVEVIRLRAGSEAATSVVYRGTSASYTDRRLRIGVTYRYVLTSFDRAGNWANATLGLRVRRLYSPAPGAGVSGPPRLAWIRVARARYYNVQLFRGREKILSAWPSRPHLQLGRRWRYDGRSFELAPGRYRWQVWPGFGRRSQGRYGRLLGKGDFVVLARRP